MFENAARYLKSERNQVSIDDRPTSSVSLVKFGPCTLQNRLEKVPRNPKLDGKMCRIVNAATDYSISVKFCTEFEHGTRSAVKVQGQGVKSQGHTMM